MFITYNEDDQVTAYSDKERNKLDLKAGESQIEVDYEFTQVGCKEGGLTYKDSCLLNDGEVVARAIIE